MQACQVCGSPSVTSLHFGGRACKACAAFFRRTVAMNMSYVCAGGTKKCRVHYEMKNICRFCRYVRCIRAGMKVDLVRSKQAFSMRPHSRCRRSSSLSERDASGTSSDGAEQASPVDEISNCQTAPDQQRTMTTPPSNERVPHHPHLLNELINRYTDLESSLNNQRKIMYTNIKLADLYPDTCEVPYRDDELRQFDYRNFMGFCRQDIIMLHEYFKHFPGFDQLTHEDKRQGFRFLCALDGTLSAAYYTYRLGKGRTQMVLFNGEYVPMDPLPITGEEEGAESLFETRADFEKYRSLFPQIIDRWMHLVIPFCNLRPSFKEYALLKTLTFWQYVFYKLSEDGRIVCQHQRDAIINALHLTCCDDDEESVNRMGSLILAMSYILNQVYKLVHNYRMMTFFDVLKCDPVLTDICFGRFS
ncbi:hypothetical protein Q1695_013418 [Nippostrongylus brasiliensis]|nr:hypothetical protein Q1695_013418 [Nippostrongylus brasiliensis]